MAIADGANNITARFIYGRGLLATATSDAAYCYHFNANGNTTALTDATQNIVNSYAYDPFGQVVDEQETIPQPFKFVGQFGVMAESYGLYYMRARYYDPSVGRFISEDPIGFAGGDVNFYAYVLNDPINAIDPSGLERVPFRTLPNGSLLYYDTERRDATIGRPTNYVDPFTQIAKQFSPYYSEFLSLIIGAIITEVTTSVACGVAAHDTINIISGIITGTTSDIPIPLTPFSIPEGIHPPDANGRSFHNTTDDSSYRSN